MPTQLTPGHLVAPEVKVTRTAVLALLVVYLLFRILFRLWPGLKEAFIYPTGILVNLMGMDGEYVNGEWVYHLQTVVFTLGDVCSGTTFFSLVMAFLAYQWRLGRISSIWFASAYPLAILANAIRVNASIALYMGLNSVQLSHLNEPFHLACGAVTFLLALLALAYLIENRRPHNE